VVSLFISRVLVIFLNCTSRLFFDVHVNAAAFLALTTYLCCKGSDVACHWCRCRLAAAYVWLACWLYAQWWFICIDERTNSQEAGNYSFTCDMGRYDMYLFF